MSREQCFFWKALVLTVAVAALPSQTVASVAGQARAVDNPTTKARPKNSTEKSKSEKLKDCIIKSNVNRKEENIYHIPGSCYDKKTKITKSKGECWFCSEEEAIQTGWRAPYR